MLTATGLGSGLDISGMVSQLVAAERAGADLQLNRESSKLNTRLSAFGSLKGALAGLQTSLGALAQAGAFGSKSVTSSNTAAFAATVTGDPVATSYTLEVNQLAGAHALASQALGSSVDATLGTGTLTFRFGTTSYDAGTDNYAGFTLDPASSITTLTIDSSNNTLEGLVDTINSADFGVRASLVNDGSGYRVLLGSETTGLAGSLQISVDDTDGNDVDGSGLSVLAFNAGATEMEQTNAATNALFKVNGLTVQSGTNVVDDAIPGLSLILKETTSAPFTLKVEQDTTTVTSAFSSFINSYNQLRGTIVTLAGYNAATGTAGVLQGDFTVRAAMNQIEGILRGNVSGVDGSYLNLAELGLKTNATGSYVLDTARFKTALLEAPQNVTQLFAALGVPDNAQLAYQAATAATEPGDYAVTVSTAASAGSYTGAGVLPDFDLGGTLTIDADNDTFALSVDGVASGTLTLGHGVYASGADLAAELQARINGAAPLVAAGLGVSVAYDSANARLVLASQSVGSTSAIAISAVDVSSAASLGLDVGAGTDGTDVAGTIGGVAAQGAGRRLTGATGSAAEGLAIEVEGSATGALGTVAFTRGVAEQLKLLLEQVLATEGGLAQRVDTINTRKQQVEARRAELELKWKAVEARYLRQFNALDGLLSSLQSTSAFLEAQLGNLPKPVSSRSNR